MIKIYQTRHLWMLARRENNEICPQDYGLLPRVTLRHIAAWFETGAYDLVGCAPQAETPEEAFLHTNHPDATEEYRQTFEGKQMWSLSIGDIIEMPDGELWICARSGFDKLDTLGWNFAVPEEKAA